MAIICKQCGYENPDGSTLCEICAESLVEAEENSVQQPADHLVATAAQTSPSVDEGIEFSIFCPESQTKTIVPRGDVTEFYCEGCKKQHEVDGFLWTIEKKIKQNAAVVSGSDTLSQANATKGDNLWLEEVNSHVRIEIGKEGGTLGRYGKYGADFFQSRGYLTVSGEHCMITYEFGNWVIRHISKTNQTMYNNMILGANEPNLLEDGKILVLANTVSFVVRIG